MKVADMLRIKGSVVKTVPPHETALLLSGQMRAEQIGALVVSRDGKSIEGIVSERDLAYGLATYGDRLPTIPISELMTKAVAVCSPEDSVTDVMKLMTMRRIRHVPVKDAINSWGSSALVMFSNTVLESWKSKQAYFGIMPWLLGARLSLSVSVRGSECDVCYWHLAEIYVRPSLVSFRRKSGRFAAGLQ